MRHEASASVAVVGAGLAGLAAACQLKRAGVRVRVFEASGRAGGAVRSERDGPWLVEYGPNSLAEPPEPARLLLRDAGLEARRLPTDASARRRYVVRAGWPVPVPLSPPDLLSTPLISVGGRLRLLREPWIAPHRGDESVAAMVRRRLGPEVLDYIVEPFVGGVYAGDPEQLSARHAFPRLKALEEKHGSLLRGMRAASAGRAPGERSAPASFSFPTGMEELPRTLAAELGNALRLDTPVRAVRRADAGWEVRCANEVDPSVFDAVVLATPAHALGRLELDAAGAETLLTVAEIPHAPIAVVALGFRRDEVAHPLDGFGMLVPRVERRRILGTLFSSTLFPGRAPAGHVLLTTFVGGERSPELAQLPADRLSALVWEELSALLGVSGAPTLVHHVAWERAIPQYRLDHGDRRDAMDALEQRNPGLFLAGSFRAGVSVGDTLVSGLAAANGVAEHLRSRRPVEV